MNIYLALCTYDDEDYIPCTAASTCHVAYEEFMAFVERENKDIVYDEEQSSYIDIDGCEAYFFEEDNFDVTEIVLERVS